MQGKTVGVGVTGGIAAYKVADLVSRLTKEGCQVHVIMTESATRFVTPLTFRTLSNHPVLLDMFDEDSDWRVQHVGLAENLDLLVIAPCTANTIAKLACGLADNLLTTVVLATRAPVLLVPSMNTNMYESKAVQENLEVLKRRGYWILEPEYGELACGVTGKGRLPEPEVIYNCIKQILGKKQELCGQTYLITAGATQEDLDPVRFITNRSTGRMGYALAEEARRRGARVILVSGPSPLPKPSGVELLEVRSARQMYEACMRYFDEADVVIGAAAVADYRPQDYSEQKIKKSDDDLVIRLARNPDILAEMGKRKTKQFLVGFAAETNEAIENGIAKLHKKNLDLMVINDVTMEGAGFGGETNIVTLVGKDGKIQELPKMAKTEVAKIIIDTVIETKK